MHNLIERCRLSFYCYEPKKSNIVFQVSVRNNNSNEFLQKEKQAQRLFNFCTSK